jgi:type IV pilus assembly protein PilA
MKLNKKKKGFTIVELVIVIGVIGVLAGILIPTFVNVNQKAEQAALKSNLANAYSSYLADAAGDGEIDDINVLSPKPTDGKKYYLVTLGQEEVVLKDAGGAYEFTTADGWKALSGAFDTDKKDIVLNETKVYASLTVTYGTFEIWSKVAHA